MLSDLLNGFNTKKIHFLAVVMANVSGFKNSVYSTYFKSPLIFEKHKFKNCI